MLLRTSEVRYRQLGPLTAAETTAAANYSDQSGMFHLLSQSDHSMALDNYDEYQKFWASQQLPNLCSATKKFELTDDVMLFSGHGNGSAVTGGFFGSDEGRYLGLKWRYRGVISTSAWEWKAVSFLEKKAGPGTQPTFLEFHLKKGSKLLPMPELGPSYCDEAEYILPAGSRFVVIDAKYRTIGQVSDVLHLTLEQD